MTITIDNYRGKSRNQTNKKHWTKYYQHKQELEELIAAKTGFKQLKPIEPAKVIIEAHYRAKRAVDVSNLDDKIIIDCLMSIGLLRDDNPDCNPEVIKRSLRSTGKDQLVIMVETMSTG